MAFFVQGMAYHPRQSLIKEKEIERTHILFMASESQGKKIQKFIDTEKSKTKRLTHSYFKRYLLTLSPSEETLLIHVHDGPNAIAIPACQCECYN